MSEVSSLRVVSFSSEHSAHPASNLLTSDAASTWQSSGPNEKSLTAVLQLEEAVVIDSLHVANAGSAFVEVFASRREETQKEMSLLLPATSFMSPVESRNEENLRRVRILNHACLKSESRDSKWDTLRIVCSQPFNKRIRYGLAFIKVFKMNEKNDKEELKKGKEEEKTKNKTMLGAFSLRADDENEPMDGAQVKIGSFFAARQRASTTSTSSTEATTSNGGTSSPAAMLRDPKASTSFAARALASVPKTSTAKYPSSPKFSETSRANKTTPKEREKKSSLSLPSRKSLPGELPSISSAKKSKAKPPTKVRPFNRLFSDVTFALSGFQNPLRSTIREKAVAMGATYERDWDKNKCSHLICAFVNTPKFNAVKKDGGRIVRKDWIEDAFENKRRRKWRHFALDKKDSGQSNGNGDSDEEIIAESEDANSGAQDTTVADEMDTDDEIEALMRQSVAKVRNKSPDNSIVKDEDDEYGADTDVDEEAGSQPIGKSTYDDLLQHLPNFFHRQQFYIHHCDEQSRKKRLLLKRKIVAAGGELHKEMKSNVTFLISTNGEWSDDFESLHPDLCLVNAHFVDACWKKRRLVDPNPYQVMPS